MLLTSSPILKPIREKVEAGERLSLDDGLILESPEAPLLEVGELADFGEWGFGRFEDEAVVEGEAFAGFDFFADGFQDGGGGEEHGQPPALPGVMLWGANFC